MLQGSLCRSHLWRRIPFSSFGKHFLSCPQFGRCCRGLRGGRQSCRQSLRDVGSFAVFGGASCWPGSRSTKRCSPPTYDGGNKLLENLIKLICMDWTGRFWTYLSFSSIFGFQMKSLRTSVRRWGHCLKKKCFLKAGKVSVDRKYNWGPICYSFPQVLVFLPPSQKQEYAWHSVSSGALWVFPHKKETSLCNTYYAVCSLDINEVFILEETQV